MEEHGLAARVTGCGKRGSPFSFFPKLSLGGGAEIAGGFVDCAADFFGAFARDIAGGGDEGLALVGVHEAGGFEKAGFVFGRYGEKAVFVGVDELAGLDGATEHFDLAAPAHGTTEGVTDAELKAAYESVKAELSSPSAPGNNRIIASAQTAAANSPPERT